ncbi:MAG: hypothetical protein N2443_04610 [Blastocatellia bacterium]|nr:hypothetical protein [Blastocatellia bacterium]
MRENKWSRRTRRATLGLLTLAFFPLTPSAQTGMQTERFTASCKNCWPGWIELARPVAGVGPSTQNGRGFIFINGFDADPMRNREHLHLLRSNEGASEATALFQFNNATIGGKLALPTGGFVCLRDVDVITTVANELFIVTIRDTGATWYGAFVGDLTVLDPDFVPDVEAPMWQGYSILGLLQMSNSELELLALKVIPLLRRFAPMRLTIALDESDSDVPTLRAELTTASGARYRVYAELDPAHRLDTGRTGVIYLVSQARPCTTLSQRELALQSFQFR